MIKMRSKLLFLLSFIIVGGTFSLLFYLEKKSRRDKKQFETEIFSLYFSAISQEKWKEAFVFHSEDSQKRFPLSDFEHHYQDVLKTEGPLQKWNVFLANSSYNLFSKQTKMNVGYQLYFKNHMIYVSYNLIQQANGTWKIDYATSSNSRYERGTLPW